MAKPKIALYWAAACGGCDVAVLDTDAFILDVAAAVWVCDWEPAETATTNAARAVKAAIALIAAVDKEIGT